MDFLSQYENLELISGGEPKAFRAWQKTPGRKVLLHQLSSNPKSGRQLHLLAMLLRHSSTRQSATNPILGIEEEGDSVWVITEDVPEMTSLTGWMAGMERADATKTAPSPPEADPAKTAALPAPVPGAAGGAPASLDEKTVLFATRLAAADSSPIVDVDATMFTAPAARESASPKVTEDATRAFPAPSPALPTQAESTLILKKPDLAAMPSDAARVIPAPSSAGESTAVFQTPAAAQPSSFLPSQPGGEKAFDPSEAPGEFTMLFRKPSAAIPEGEQKLRFMGFTAPGQEKARFIEASDAPSARPSLDEPTPASNVLKPSGNFVFRPPEASAPEPANPEPTRFFDLPDFPSAPAGESIGMPGASQPGEFTQVFQRPPASSETRESQEPGAFTRIFQIPVGSDLLSEAESNTIFSRPAAPAPPPAEPQFSAPAPPELKADPAPAVTPAAQAIPSFKPPVVPSVGGLKAPAIPPVPKIPAVPAGGGGKAPGLAAPKIPAVPKMPAAPKLPKVPGAAAAEKAAGAAGPSALPLILIFGGIVLVAVLTVLFFVTRH